MRSLLQFRDRERPPGGMSTRAGEPEPCPARLADPLELAPCSGPGVPRSRPRPSSRRAEEHGARSSALSEALPSRAAPRRGLVLGGPGPARPGIGSGRDPGVLWPGASDLDAGCRRHETRRRESTTHDRFARTSSRRGRWPRGIVLGPHAGRSRGDARARRLAGPAQRRPPGPARGRA